MYNCLHAVKGYQNWCFARVSWGLIKHSAQEPGWRAGGECCHLPPCARTAELEFLPVLGGSFAITAPLLLGRVACGFPLQLVLHCNDSFLVLFYP